MNKSRKPKNPKKLIITAKDKRPKGKPLFPTNVQFKENLERIGCCSKHWLPAGEVCEDYQADTGPGVLMKRCTNCYYFNDRSKKYKKLPRK
jgi:hypothetical protein